MKTRALEIDPALSQPEGRYCSSKEGAARQDDPQTPSDTAMPGKLGETGRWERAMATTNQAMPRLIGGQTSGTSNEGCNAANAWAKVDATSADANA